MNESSFDRLLQKAAQETTRRGALAAVVGGALLLTTRAETGATKKAERRKKRKKRAAALTKPIALWLDNTAGTSAVTVTVGDKVRKECCSTISAVVVPAGERKRVGFRRAAWNKDSYAFMWIAGPDPQRARYWLDFINPGVGLPKVSAAVDGVASRFPFPQPWCCFPTGQTVLSEKGLNPNEMVNITMRGQVFNVRRIRDTNYKEFTVTLPANL